MLKFDQPPTQILAIGEPMLELSGIDPATGEARFGVAGDTLNTAVYLARAFAGDATQVDYLTVLGRDPFSDQMMDWMAHEGIGTDLIGRHPTRLPGLYAIDVDETGERSFHYWRASSAARTLFEDTPPEAAGIAEAEIIYLSGITLAILTASARTALVAACARAKAEGRAVVFDSNYRPRLWQNPDEARQTFEAMWAATTLGLPSADDEVELHPGEAAERTVQRVAALGVEEIVLKRGAEGPLLYSAGELSGPKVAPAKTVVDTTAAGDSFNAGYLHARLTGRDPVKAITAAHRLACRVIAHPGAILPRD